MGSSSYLLSCVCFPYVEHMSNCLSYSPAKTNLFLRITRKREDGFHELASVFQVAIVAMASTALLTMTMVL